MGAFTQHVEQFVALTEDAGDLPKDIDILLVGIHVVGRVRCVLGALRVPLLSGRYQGLARDCVLITCWILALETSIDGVVLVFELFGISRSCLDVAWLHKNNLPICLFIIS